MACYRWRKKKFGCLAESWLNWIYYKPTSLCFSANTACIRCDSSAVIGGEVEFSQMRGKKVLK